MGKGEGASGETKADDFSSRQKEDRGGTKGEVGEVEGGEEQVGGLSSLRNLNSWRSHPLRLKEALPRCEDVLHQIKALKACAMV